MFGWFKPKVRDEVDLVIGLILQNEDWIKCSHAWWHKSGVCVWTANRWYGTDIKFESKGVHDYDCGGSGIKLTNIEKEEIGKAVETVEALDKAMAEKVKDLKHRAAVLMASRKIEQMYGT